jgi:poly(beta-D-mannuronate) lyase
VRARSTASACFAGVALAASVSAAAAGGPCSDEPADSCRAAGPDAPAGGRPARALRGPVDVEARRALIGQPLPPAPPSRFGPPVRDVWGVSYYVDAARTIVDPALKAANERSLAPLRRFVAEVVRFSDGWLASRPRQPAYAARAVDGLFAWASAGALLGQVNQQGEYEREWTLAGLALAYLEVRDAPGLPVAARQTVETWLAALADAIRPSYQRPDRRSSANNHAYWAGLAAAAAGVASARRDLFDWGIARGRVGLRQIRADGLLPLELGRGKLALHYHLFALAPLLMLAEIAAANGVPFYEADGHALDRLIDRVTDGLRDPAPFAAAAGAPQEIALPPRGADLAWAEIAFARLHDRRLAAWIGPARPLREDRLGGDLTAAFGVPALK